MDYYATFDSKASGWSSSDECNYMYLRQQEIYFNTVLKHRGYIYLNQIYELLGIGWSPRWTNPCFESDTHSNISIVPKPLGELEYEVTINIQ